MKSLGTCSFLFIYLFIYFFSYELGAALKVFRPCAKGERPLREKHTSTTAESDQNSFRVHCVVRFSFFLFVCLLIFSLFFIISFLLDSVFCLELVAAVICETASLTPTLPVSDQRKRAALPPYGIQAMNPLQCVSQHASAKESERIQSNPRGMRPASSLPSGAAANGKRPADADKQTSSGRRRPASSRSGPRHKDRVKDATGGKDRSECKSSGSDVADVGNTAKSNETAYLKQKLRDVLDRQVLTDEQHQQNMITTRQLLRRMYDENATLRNIISSAEFRKRNEGRVASLDDPPSVTDAEVAVLSNRINITRRSYNRLLHELRQLTVQVTEEERKERDHMEAIAATAGTLDPAAMYAALSGNKTLSLRIQKLERQLNDVLARQRVVSMIIDGYAGQILELNKERTEYNNQLKSLEQQFLDRHRDHLHLVTLFQNAQYDYEKLVAQRTAYTQHVRKQRRLKEKLLADRRTEVQQAILETERHNRALVELQLVLDEEAQRLEEVEAMHQDLIARSARQRDVDALLATGSNGAGAGGEEYTDPGSGRDAEQEEQLSAYHIAVQELLKETKAESRQRLVPLFQAEVQQYEQLRAQVEMKRERLDRLEGEVKQLRSKWANARVSASATAVVPQASSTLEEELKVFLSESEEELAAVVAEEERRRLLLRDLAAQGNRLITLLAPYRPDIPLRPLKEVDPHLPIHFTALAQKLLSLSDEATLGAGARGVPPPAPATAIVIPENNVRVKLQKPAASGGEKKKVATMASAGAAAVLQQRTGAAGGRSGSTMDQSLPILGQSFSLIQDDMNDPYAAPVVTSDLDDAADEEDETSSQGSREPGMGYSGGTDTLAPNGSLSMGASTTTTTGQLPPRGPGGKGKPKGGRSSGGSGGGPRSGSTTIVPGRGSSIASDEPLLRTELKRVSMAIKERERKRLLVEEKQEELLYKFVWDKRDCIFPHTYYGTPYESCSCLIIIIIWGGKNEDSNNQPSWTGILLVSQRDEIGGAVSLSFALSSSFCHDQKAPPSIDEGHRSQEATLPVMLFTFSNDISHLKQNERLGFYPIAELVDSLPPPPACTSRPWLAAATTHLKETRGWGNEEKRSSKYPHTQQKRNKSNALVALHPPQMKRNAGRLALHFLHISSPLLFPSFFVFSCVVRRVVPLVSRHSFRDSLLGRAEVHPPSRSVPFQIIFPLDCLYTSLRVLCLCLIVIIIYYLFIIYISVLPFYYRYSLRQGDTVGAPYCLCVVSFIHSYLLVVVLCVDPTHCCCGDWLENKSTAEAAWPSFKQPSSQVFLLVYCYVEHMQTSTTIRGVEDIAPELIDSISPSIERFITDIKSGRIGGYRGTSLSTAAAQAMVSLMSSIIERFQEFENEAGNMANCMGSPNGSHPDGRSRDRGRSEVEAVSNQVTRLLHLIARTSDALIRPQFGTLLLTNVTRRVLSIIRDAAVEARASTEEIQRMSVSFCGPWSDGSPASLPYASEGGSGGGFPLLPPNIGLRETRTWRSVALDGGESAGRPTATTGMPSRLCGTPRSGDSEEETDADTGGLQKTDTSTSGSCQAMLSASPQPSPAPATHGTGGAGGVESDSTTSLSPITPREAALAGASPAADSTGGRPPPLAPTPSQRLDHLSRPPPTSSPLSASTRGSSVSPSRTPSRHLRGQRQRSSRRPPAWNPEASTTSLFSEEEASGSGSGRVPGISGGEGRCNRLSPTATSRQPPQDDHGPLFNNQPSSHYSNNNNSWLTLPPPYAAHIVRFSGMGSGVQLPEALGDNPLHLSTALTDTKVGSELPGHHTLRRVQCHRDPSLCLSSSFTDSRSGTEGNTVPAAGAPAAAVRASSSVLSYSPTNAPSAGSAAVYDTASGALSQPPQHPSVAHEFPVRLTEFYDGCLRGLEELGSEVAAMTDELCKRVERQIHRGDVIISIGCTHTVRQYLLAASNLQRFRVVLLDGAPTPLLMVDQLAAELRARGVEVQRLPDSSAFAVMNTCTKVVIGAESVLANGGMLAPIGSRLLCVAARHFAVPVLVATTTLKMSPYYPSDPLCTRLVRITKAKAQELPWSIYGAPELILPMPNGVWVNSYLNPCAASEFGDASLLGFTGSYGGASSSRHGSTQASPTTLYSPGRFQQHRSPVSLMCSPRELNRMKPDPSCRGWNALRVTHVCVHCAATEYVPPEYVTLYATNEAELAPSQCHRIIRANYNDAD
eukprot:gene9541-6698_t